MMPEKTRGWKNYYDMEHSTYQDTGIGNQVLQRFAADSNEDILIKDLTFTFEKKNIGVFEALGKIKACFNSSRIVMFDKKNFHIMGEILGSDALIRGKIEDAAEAAILALSIAGSNQVVSTLTDELNKALWGESLPSIRWWFNGIHGAEDKTLHLTAGCDVIRPEFYPSIGDAEAYIDEFIDSKEAVLLLAGPPGTGKTSLLRNVIYKRKLCVHVIYDEKLMQQDEVFQEFLFGEGDIMVIEDADTILSSRERDGNKLMSRFLNISDGLTKLPSKKMVFSTNITDFGNIDSALVRPGRCFGIMHTRGLTFEEAIIAAEAAGLPVPTKRKDYTLAELFANGKTQAIRKIGFT